MKNIYIGTPASILAFIDWIHTQTWTPHTFFQFLYQWFTKEAGILSDTERYLVSASFLLEKSQNEKNIISDEAVSLWNNLVLSTSRFKEHYASLTSEDILEILNHLKHILTQDFNSSTSYHRLISNYSISEKDQTFIKRDVLLSKLHIWLSSESQPAFLYGIAGIGKSTLAKMYISYYRDFYDTIIFATYEESLLELVISDTAFPITNLSFKSFGKRGEKGRYFRKKLNILSSLVSSRTLIVIDNFDTTNDSHLSDILKLPCKIIFTTRTLPNGFGKQGIEVPALSSKEEQRKLFCHYHPSPYISEELDQLLDFLHGHTLTIQLTAAHLETTGQTINNLFEQGTDFLHVTDIEDQLVKLFQLTSLTKEERAVLRYLSIMPITGIDLNHFSEYCHFTKMSVVDSLTQRNLIQMNRLGNLITIHPLLASVVRTIEKPTFSNCWSYASTICQLGKQTWWFTSEQTNEYREYLFALMKYLVEPEERRMDSLIYLVDGCWQLGNFSLAEKYGKTLHAYCLKHFGTSHLMTARIRHSLGTIYYNWGKIDKAFKWYALGYHDYKNSPSPDVYFYGILLMKVGRTMRLQKNWIESERFLTNAIDFLQIHLNTTPDLPANESPKAGWLVLLFDIYSEIIALYVDQKQMKLSWNWCLRYKQEYEELHLQRDSSLWILYYYMGLSRIGMLSETDKSQEYRNEAIHYLHLSLDYAQKYHKQNISIHLKILEALKSITSSSKEKLKIQQEIRKLKM